MDNLVKILVIILFSSCFSCGTSLNTISNNEERIELTSENLQQFNGTYKRFSINDTIINEKHYCPNNLFNSFFLGVPYRYWLPDNNDERDFTKIEVIDKNKIKINLTENGKLEKSKILRGKIIGNSFVFNRRTFIIPLVLLDFYSERKTRISILQNGNLSVDTLYGAYGNFFIFPWNGAGGEYYDLVFEKVE